MKPFFRIFSVLALVFCVATAHAIAPDALTIGKEPVVDQAEMLSADDEAALNQKLRALQQAQVMQGAVVLVDDLAGKRDFDYGMAVFSRWQLGDRERNDGLLILLSKKEHAIRIITGRGLEEAIPDAFAKQVINGMVPHFRAGNFAAGLNAGVDSLAAQLQAEPEERASNLAQFATEDMATDSTQTGPALSLILAIAAACFRRERVRALFLALAGGVLYFVSGQSPLIVLIILLFSFVLAGILRGIVRGLAGGGRSYHDDSDDDNDDDDNNSSLWAC